MLKDFKEFSVFFEIIILIEFICCIFKSLIVGCNEKCVGKYNFG